MKNKIIALTLTFVLTFSVVSTPVYADVIGYVTTAGKAVNITQQAIQALGIDKMGEVGQGFSTFIKYLGKGIGTTNTILKFLGFGDGGEKHPTTTELMYAEIQEMHQEIQHIDSVVEKMSDELSDFKSEEEFRDIVNDVNRLNSEWNSFEQKNIQDGMQKRLKEYDWLIRDGVEIWCKNKTSDARIIEDIDNRELALMYEDNGDLVYTRENGIPSEKSGYKSIVLKSKCFPEKYTSWTMDAYNDVLGKSIRDNVSNALKNGNVDEYITVHNYPIFTSAGWNNASDTEKEEALNQLCIDANNVLLFRISVGMINQNSDFVRDTIDTFNNYCTNLIGKRNTGFDAFIQALYLTNGFEGELKDSYNTFCNEMVVMTGEFATFALDVIGKSDKATKRETDPGSDANIAAQNWLNVADVLKGAIDNGLTGNDDYCYQTGNRVDIIPLTFTFGIKCSYKGDYNVTKTEVTEVAAIPQCNDEFHHNTLWDIGFKYNGDVMSNTIPSNKAQALNYLYLSKNGTGKANFREYLEDNCSKTFYHNYDCVTSQYLAGVDPNAADLTSADNNLLVSSVNDDYDIGVPINNPKYGDINQKLVQTKKKVYGKVIDISTGKINNNAVIGAIVFGKTPDHMGFYMKKYLDTAPSGYVSSYSDCNFDTGGKYFTARNRSRQYFTLVYHDESRKEPTSRNLASVTTQEVDPENINISELGQDYDPIDSLEFTLATRGMRDIARDEIEKAAGKKSKRSDDVKKLVKKAYKKIDYVPTSAEVQAFRIQYSYLIKETKKINKIRITKKSVVSTKSGKLKLKKAKYDGKYIKKYDIYRSTKKSKGFKKIASITKNSGKSFTFKDKKKRRYGRTYYYKVKGVVKLNDGTSVHTR